MDIHDENKAIWELTHKAYWDEYKECSEAWKTLETKAQAMITSNGIFLAGAFAFAREAQLSSGVTLFTVLTLFALLASMCCALRVIKAMDYETPVDGCHLTDIGLTGMMHHTDLAKPTGQRLRQMYEIALQDRRKVIQTIEQSLDEKICYLASSHRLLLLASLFAVLASTLHITRNISQGKDTLPPDEARTQNVSR